MYYPQPLYSIPQTVTQKSVHVVKKTHQVSNRVQTPYKAPGVQRQEEMSPECEELTAVEEDEDTYSSVSPSPDTSSQNKELRSSQ